MDAPTISALAKVSAAHACKPDCIGTAPRPPSVLSAAGARTASPWSASQTSGANAAATHGAKGTQRIFQSQHTDQMCRHMTAGQFHRMSVAREVTRRASRTLDIAVLRAALGGDDCAENGGMGG